MLSIKASFLKKPRTLKVYLYFSDKRHISTKAISPNPKPQSKGPNKIMQMILHTPLFDKATDPVMQMKKRRLSIGYKTAIM